MPNKIIQQVATGSLIECLKLVRCGFELETQTVGGYSEDNYCATRYENDDEDNTPEWEEFVSDTLDIDSQGMDWVVDGSVDGVEIRTKGAPTAAAFLRSAKYVFKLVQQKIITVDSHCSFHIHISFPGVKHKYTSRFQRLLIEGLLKQAHTLPDSVLERWANSNWREQYFQLNLSDDKYTFINFHDSLETWEFRCFGNVSTFHEAVACLKAAILAFKFAYRVNLKLEKHEFNDSAYSRIWTKKLNSLFGESESFKVFQNSFNKALLEEGQRQKAIRRRAAESKRQQTAELTAAS